MNEILFTIAIGILTYATCLTMQVLFAFGSAAGARLLGIAVSQINVGIGPALLQRKWAGVSIRVAAIPISASISMNDPHADAPAAEESNLPPGELLVLSMIGPLLHVIVGLALLSLCVALNDKQWVVHAGQDASASPCAVPGLVITEEPATWSGQMQLLRDTAGDFFWRVATFDSMDGWGALIGILATAVAMAEFGLPSWGVAMGVLFLVVGVVNFMPLPPMNGFHVVHGAWQLVFGRPITFKLRVNLVFVGFVVYLAILVRFVLIDYHWISSAWQ